MLTAAAVGTRTKAFAAPTLQPVKVVIPQESVFVLNYMGAKDAGVFAKHGIDLDIDARPFAGFLAGLPSKQCMAVTYSGIDAIQKINEGLDWVIHRRRTDGGAGCDRPQGFADTRRRPTCAARNSASSPLAPARSSAARAAMIDAFKIDVAKDTESAASRRAGVDQASGERPARCHDQHQLAEPRGGSADPTNFACCFRPTIIGTRRPATRSCGRRRSSPGEAGSTKIRRARRTSPRRRRIRSAGWRSRKISRPR